MGMLCGHNLCCHTNAGKLGRDTKTAAVPNPLATQGRARQAGPVPCRARDAKEPSSLVPLSPMLG